MKRLMTTLLDQAADLLYNRPGRRTLHVAFYIPPGSHPSADDLARQVIETEALIASGKAVPIKSID